MNCVAITMPKIPLLSIRDSDDPCDYSSVILCLSFPGYYYHSATGFYYDANTGLFFDNNKQQWLVYDQDKQDYVPYADCGSSKAKESDGKGMAVEHNTEVTSSAARNAVEGTNASMHQIKNGNAKAENKGDRRRGATIGAKPQLNPEGLLAAAKAEHVSCHSPFICSVLD